jgi:hypothetical protein
VDPLDVFGLIPLTLGFMIVHNLLDFLAKLIRRQPRHETGAQVARMNRNFRIAHWGVYSQLPDTGYHGFALKYPEAWWARPLLLLGRAFRVSRCGASYRGGCPGCFDGLPPDSPRGKPAIACS